MKRLLPLRKNSFGIPETIAVLAVVLMLALAALPTAKASEAPAEQEVVKTVGKSAQRGCGDGVGVIWRKTMNLPPRNVNIDTRSRLSYRVPCSLAYLEVYRLRGRFNVEGESERCTRFREVRFRFEFSDGRTRTLEVPCDEDTVNSGSRRVSLRFYAQDPCPIGPVCPPATKFRVKHTADVSLTGDPSWTSRWTFIA